MRLVLAPVLLVLGGLEATAGVLVHARLAGLLLAMAAGLATAAAAPGGWWARLPFSLGWVASVLYFSHRRHEGDLLVTADARGEILVGFGIALAVLAVTTLRPPRSSASPASDPPRQVPDPQDPAS